MTVDAMKVSPFKCGECGAHGCRLYRPYGEFRRPEGDRCNAHVPDDGRGWWIPLIYDGDGTTWGYTSSTEKAIEECFTLLNDADVDAKKWDEGHWHKATCRSSSGQRDLEWVDGKMLCKFCGE